MFQRCGHLQIRSKGWACGKPTFHLSLLGLMHVGTVRKQPVSPFRKRAAAPDAYDPKQDRPLILIVSCPTWGALFQTLLTALAGPRQLQSQTERQNLLSVDLQLPPEQSSGLLTEGSEDEIDIMNVDSAPVTTQLLDQPEHAEQSLAVGGGSSWANPTDTSENAPAGEHIEQARVQQQEPQQAIQKRATDAGRPLPARVSRRLEARRWAPVHSLDLRLVDLRHTLVP